MRCWLILVALLALSACGQADVVRLDSRTFQINGPDIPGGSDAPNRRIADQVCPQGYRLLDQEVHRNAPDRYHDASPGSVFTNWKIRCL